MPSSDEGSSDSAPADIDAQSLSRLQFDTEMDRIDALVIQVRRRHAQINEDFLRGVDALYEMDRMLQGAARDLEDITRITGELSNAVSRLRLLGHADRASDETSQFDSDVSNPADIRKADVEADAARRRESVARIRSIDIHRREIAAHQRAIETHEKAAILFEGEGMSDEARNARERAKHVRQRLEQAIAEQKLHQGDNANQASPTVGATDRRKRARA